MTGKKSLKALQGRIEVLLTKRGGALLPEPVGNAARAGTKVRAKKLADFISNRLMIEVTPDGKAKQCYMGEMFNSCKKYAQQGEGVYVYDTPWDTEGRDIHFCGEECRDAYLYSGDFQFQDCPDCQRLICQQNPRNGYMGQFRDLGGGIEICLRCYEAEILENGCDPAKFKAGILPGMFFSGDNSEPLNAGFEYVPHYESAFIDGDLDARAACSAALDLIERGGKVICGFELLSNCGGEGFVSLFCKGVDLGAWETDYFGGEYEPLQNRG